MTMRAFVVALVGLATLGLGGGYAWREAWTLVTAIVAFGLLWGVGYWRGLGWTASVGFVFFVMMAALGLLSQIPLTLILACALATLVAWDLSYFRQHLDQGDVREALYLRLVHFFRLGGIIILGLLLGWVTLRLQTTLRPVWGIGLGILIIVGLSRMVRFLRQESD